MRLSSDRFSTGVFVYRDANGQTREGVRYSYETGSALYDVQMYEQATVFKVNCQIATFTPIHRQIVNHYLR